MKRIGFLLAVMCLCALSSRAQEAALTLSGIDGKTYEPLNPAGKKAAVIFFVSPYCSTSNTFAPEMNAIVADFGEGFVFRFVHSDPSAKPADILQHAELMEFKAPVLIDAAQVLVRKLGAKVTPEVVVIGADGKALYQGRINDLYKGPTRRQREATTRDLRDALEAIREGKPVAAGQIAAVGCEISGLK
jgi:thiol-disulfide isomerase/thioredoxin